MLGVGLVPAHADTIQVVIDKLVFSPAEINAKVGDTIEWVKDILAHTATVRGDWDVMIAANKSASIVLRKRQAPSLARSGNGCHDARYRSRSHNAEC
jgi:plastocyanin